MKMKFRTAAGLAAIAAALSVSGFALAAAPAEKVESAAETPGYIVGSAEGKVAVFPPDGGDPVKMTEIELKSLPRADRSALENGIFVENDDELARILEDLGS